MEILSDAACGMLEGCCPRAAAVLEEAEPDALAYLDFPPTHWKRLRSDNVQERTNREMRRRPRVVQVFPSTGSLARLAGAVMCEQCVSSRGFEQKEHRKLSSRSIGSAHAF